MAAGLAGEVDLHYHLQGLDGPCVTCSRFVRDERSQTPRLARRSRLSTLVARECDFCPVRLFGPRAPTAGAVQRFTLQGTVRNSANRSCAFSERSRGIRERSFTPLHSSRAKDQSTRARVEFTPKWVSIAHIVSTTYPQEGEI